MPYFEKKSPSSNSNHIGIAKVICDTTSGGVNNIPSINEHIITYDLFFMSKFFEIKSIFIIMFIIIGI